MLTSSQLLRLIAIIAILLLVFGKECGARRAILVVLAVIIVCGCVAGPTAGIGAGYGMAGAVPYGAGAYSPVYDGF